MNTIHSILQQPRPLTFDEKRAAEAAFAGEAPSATWSEAGQRVYEGLVAALFERAGEALTHDCDAWLVSSVEEQV